MGVNNHPGVLTRSSDSGRAHWLTWLDMVSRIPMPSAHYYRGLVEENCMDRRLIWRLSREGSPSWRRDRPS